MKNLLLILSLSITFAIANGQEVDSLIFCENYQSEAIQVKTISELHVKNNSSDFVSPIEASTSSDIPGNVMNCINQAVKIWGECIKNYVPLNIEFVYEPLSYDTRTAVQYLYKSNEAQPRALFNYTRHISATENMAPVGRIHINSQTEWDYSTNGVTTGSRKNLTFALLRCISRVLGFGSSISFDSNGKYCYGVGSRPTSFDRVIITSDGKKLTDLSCNDTNISDKLKEFLLKENRKFYVSSIDDGYELCLAGGIDQAPLTMTYSGLMAINPTEKDYTLVIDKSTLQMLKQIGWDFSVKPKINIIGNDVLSNGCVSAYVTHRFYIDNKNSDMLNRKWIFTVKQKNGEYRKMELSDNDFSCIIPTIDSEEYYQIDSNGNIECALVFSYTYKGEELQSAPLNMVWNLKPFIEEVKLLSRTDNYPYSTYDANLQVKYLGSDKINVFVDEEYNPIIQEYELDEPYIATVTVRDIKKNYFAWVDFTAKNQYGTTTYTYELEPYTVQSNKISSMNGIIGFKADKKMDFSKIIEGGDPIDFSIDENRINSKWTLYVKKNDQYSTVIAEANGGSTFRFNPRDISLKWHECNTTFDSELYSKIHHFKIVYSSSTIKDSIEFSMALLPSIPRIVDAGYKCFEYDWEKDRATSNSIFELDIVGERAFWYEIFVSGSGLFSAPDFYEGVFLNENPEQTIWASNEIGWGEYLTVTARNEFGESICTDTICSTDYITDPLVLERLEQIRTSAIEDVSSDEITISYIGSCIQLSEVVKYLWVYSTTGMLMSEACNTDSLDLSNLPTGCYILKTSHPNTKTLKLLKK